MIHISIHAPAGGATPISGRCGGLSVPYFNSRPCGRGDQVAIPVLLLPSISIHAPAGGATRSRQSSSVCRQFQFTPLREGRPVSGNTVSARLRHFNSRPCGRGDQCLGKFLVGGISISIHAPAGGATRNVGDQLAVHNISIHAPAGGATKMVSAGVTWTIFQFTPLREGRPWALP